MKFKEDTIKGLVNKHINFTALFEELIEGIKDVAILSNIDYEENEGNLKVLDFYKNQYKQDDYRISHEYSEIGTHGAITFSFEPYYGRWGSIYFNQGKFRWVNDGIQRNEEWEE